MTLGAVVAANAAGDPDGVAYTGAGELTWAEYSARADALAATLATRYERGARVAVQMADGAAVHLAYLAAERAGVVVVGIGSRAGAREVEHLVARTGAVDLLTELPAVDHGCAAVDPARAFTAEELWFLN